MEINNSFSVLLLTTIRYSHRISNESHRFPTVFIPHGGGPWEQAPNARECHPESEHLAPLFVVAGAANSDPGRRAYGDKLGPHAVSAFQFG